MLENCYESVMWALPVFFMVNDDVSAEDSVNYAYLMNVLKALIGKAHTLLTIDHLLPHLPQTAMSPTFFDDFRTYCSTEEWLNFMHNYVGSQLVEW